MTFRSTFDLALLEGFNGFTFETPDLIGSTVVSNAGDINGDGIDDAIIGAPTVDQGLSRETAGASYVLFGSETSFSRTFTPADLDGTNGFAINGVEEFDEAGAAVSAAGDVNGDGIDDVIIGAPTSRFSRNSSNFDGKSYVVFGSAAGFSPELELSDLDGTNGFVINGVEDGDAFGDSVSGAGDVNGDGIDDVIVRASVTNQNYVVFGSQAGFGSEINAADLDGSNGFVIENEMESARDFNGNAVSAAGDVNGDGIDDLILGADRDAPDGVQTGSSYVIFGTAEGFDSTLAISSLNGSNGFAIPGINAADNAGDAVSGAGDVNGDGIDDVIIGAFGADAQGDRAGESYVVFGRAGGFDSRLDLTSLDGTNGFVLTGTAEGNLTGRAVSGAGDVNGDGIDDVIVGALGTEVDGGSSTGESYIVYGSRSGFERTIDLSTLNGVNGFTIQGLSNFDVLGASVSGAGDLNNDGIDDLIIGADGESYVIFGQTGVPEPNIPDPNARENLNPVSGGTPGNDGIRGTDEGDFIQAFAGNDVLEGRAGGDFLDGGEGVDTVVYQFDESGVRVDLSAGFAVDGTGIADGLFNLENVIGSSFADEIKGNEAANSLTGGAGDDVLEGAAGDDTLLGGEGADRLLGGGGADKYLYTVSTEGGDTIVDFEVGSDQLVLVGEAFGGLLRGAIAPEQFFIDTPPTSRGAQLGYNTATGEVLFDADGAGGADAKVLATLLGTPGFSNTDITVL